MRNCAAMRKKRRGQEGYALTLVIFLLALIVIASAAAMPDILTNGRREKEEEMIWRGKQYVRGIRLYVRYYQTHGGTTRFPTSMEDLTKNKVGIRFMRQAYKDPVNPVDGSWRMIYVGPNGQLIGSLKSRPVLPDGQGSSASGSSGGFGSLFGSSQAQSGSNSSFGSSSFGSSSFGNSSFNNGGNSNAANPQGQAAGQGAAGNLSSDTMSTPQAIANSDGTTDVVGGNIIGVGSKVNKASIIWYDKAKNYRQFEFIWDPSKEPINGGAAAGVIGVPPAGTQGGQNGILGNQGGNSGFGQQPSGSPTGNPTGNPNSGTGTNPPPGQMPGQNPPQ
jgi:hypothetical protein